MSSISGSGFSLGTLFVNVAAQVDDALKQLQTFFAESSKGAEQSAASWGSLTGAVTGLGELKVAEVLAEWGNEAIHAAEQVNRFQSAIEALIGPTEEAEKVIEGVRELAATSPFAFPELADATQKMIALGMSADDAQKTLQTVVDTATLFRKGPEFIGTVTTALAKMEEQGTVTNRAMQALVTQGIPAWTQLAQTMGTSVSTAMALVKGGLVDAGTELEAFRTKMGEVVDGATGKWSETWSGALKGFKGEFDEVMVDVGKTVLDLLETYIVPVIDAATEKLKEFRDWWANLDPSIKETITTVALAVAAFTTVAAAVAGVTSILGALAIGFDPIVLAIGAVIVALALLGKWIADHWDAITSTLTLAWNDLAAKWAGPFKEAKAIIEGFIDSTLADLKLYIAFWEKVYGIVSGFVSKLLGNSDELQKLAQNFKDVQAATDEASQAAEDNTSALADQRAAEKALQDQLDKSANAAKVLGVQSQKDLDDRVTAAKAAAEILISNDKQLAQSGEITWAEYSRDVAAAHQAVIDAQKKAAEGSSNMVAAQKAAAKEMAETQKLIDAYNKSLIDESKSQDAVTKTMAKGFEAQNKQAAGYVAITATLKDLNPVIAQAIADNKALEAAFKQLGITSQGQLEAMARAADQDFYKIEQAYFKGTASETDYVEATKRVVAIHKQVADYINKDLTDAYKGLGFTSTQQLTESLTKAQQWAATVQAAFAAGKASMADVEAAEERVRAAQQALADNANGALNKAFNDLGTKSIAQFQTMADEAERDYQRIASSADANSLAAEQAWVTKTQAAYTAIVEAGGTLTEDQKTQLAKRQIDIEQAQEKTVSTYKATYESIKTAVGTAFDSLENTLITGDGSFGDAMTKMWQSIAKSALDDFIAPVKKAIAEFIATTIADLLHGDGLGGVLDSLKAIGSAMSDVFTGASKAASGVAGAAGSAGSAASGAAGAASSGSSAASGAASAAGSITGIVGAVGGVVSAVSGVVSNFQLAGVNKSLDVLVNHTLRIYNETFNRRRDAWDQHNSAMDRLGEVENAVYTIMDRAGEITGYLEAIRPIADNTLAVLNEVLDHDYARDQVEDARADKMLAVFEKISASIDRMGAGLNVTLTGSDPATVAQKLGQQLRLQGATA
jgi:phage tail tape-measure protein